MRVFLDSNVLFSAALPHSRIGQFLKVLHKRAELVTSPAAVEEASRNLNRKTADPSRDHASLQELLRIVTLTSLMADTTGVTLAEKDRHILGAAMASRCSHLLTGDERHFKHLFGKTLSGVKVVHAALLAAEIGLKSSPR